MGSASVAEMLIQWADARNRRTRTIVPGVVAKPGTAEPGEQAVDFLPAIADLADGKPVPPSITPGAPMMNIAAGGFYVLLPILPADETLGLVCDRATGEWVQSRIPGQADLINGDRSKVLSDIVCTPFMITAPEGAPPTWDHLVIGGVLGPAFELTTAGAVTITKGGATVATISLDEAGSVTIDVVPGQSVNLGGAAAVALAKNDALVAAIDVFIAALVAAGSGPTYAGAGAAQTAWNGVKNTFATTKAKGE